MDGPAADRIVGLVANYYICAVAIRLKTAVGCHYANLIAVIRGQAA